MNEQMQKLFQEAIAYADSKVPANDRYNDIYHSIVRGKFAELIVKEVLDEVLQAMDDGMDVYDTVADKFGVEE